MLSKNKYKQLVSEILVDCSYTQITTLHDVLTTFIALEETKNKVEQ